MGNFWKSPPTLEDVVWEMRFKSRQMSQLSAKCNQEVSREKRRVKEAIETSNTEGARIHAENAIRKHHESLNYLRMSSKMEAVASRLETANRAQSLSADIRRALPSLQNVMQELDPTSMTFDMDRFSAIFENLDVSSATLANGIDHTTAATTPNDEVENLISQVGGEHALDVANMLRGTPLGGVEGVSHTTAEATPMQNRVNRLRM